MQAPSRKNLHRGGAGTFCRNPGSGSGRLLSGRTRSPAVACGLPAACLYRERRPDCPQNGDSIMKVLVRTPEGVEEVREVDYDWVIPSDVLDDGSVVLEFWDELSDDDYLAMGLYD
jgi:hypothetical protein